jgi:hypothetical protein
MLLSSK